MANSSDKLTKQQKERLETILFAAESDTEQPTLKTYAVVDSAKDESVFYYLEGLDAEYACLFQNEEAKKLASVAPYLIRLEPGSKVTEWFINKLYGNSLGFILQSSDSITGLTAYFSDKIRTKLPDSKQKGYFRFYDPVVLSSYLEALAEEDAVSEFMGNVKNLLIEVGNGLELHQYAKDEDSEEVAMNIVDLDSQDTEEQVA